MAWYRALGLSAFFHLSYCVVEFPPSFKFGAGTASYQTEGAWNVSGKSESIWDRLTHSRPGNVLNGNTGDVACDSYNKWREDIQIAEELGLDFYRFSLSWTRLLPTGLPDKINKDGVNYYNNLINGLLDKGIEPMVTIYHWDLPQRLQDLGGWTNPLISDWFADYAKIVFTLFGDRVKTWITINEPLIFCDTGYDDGKMAPGVKDPELGNYLCNKHVLVAHAKAWRIYDEEFRALYGGRISITNALIWYEPENEGDEELANLTNELCIGMHSHAIFSKEGGWPPNAEKAIAEYSAIQGMPYSRLPAFTVDEIKLIKGTYDFYAFNYYVSRTTRKALRGEVIPSWPILGSPVLNSIHDYKPGWKKTSVPWFQIYPQGFRKLFTYLKKQYGDLEFVITENGCAGSGYGLNDEFRVEYLRDHMEQLLAAVGDGANITHYTVWSLIDVFEWLDGYSTKFGLYEVDFESKDRKRSPRSSAIYYKNVIKTRSLLQPEQIHTEL